MKAVITVIGRDMVGILARVATVCSNSYANVLEVTQSVLQEYFCMVMIVEIDKLNCELDELKQRLEAECPDMLIHVMHEDIFNSMHRI